jgi:hypothetical protein
MRRVRKYVYSAQRDPLTHVDYGHVAGSWPEVFAVTGWRPSRAVVVHRSKLDAETIRWLAEFHRLNKGN